MAIRPTSSAAHALEPRSGELMYPGEEAPLQLRQGGQPITDDEALGVARRWARDANQRLGRNEPLPTELPLPSAPGVTPLASFRVPPREVMIARAKAEMEGQTLTEVVRDIFNAYNRSEPGAVVQYSYKGPRPTDVHSVPTKPGMLPGEDAPLPIRLGGQPIREDEALGVARRWIREANERLGRNDPLPTELPLPSSGGVTPIASFRIAKREVMIARAKAEMEHRSLTEVLREGLSAYSRSEPGAQVSYVYRSTRHPGADKGKKK